MELKIIHNANEAYEFLKNKPRYDYIYQFNDLSPGEWNNVICYGLYCEREIKQVAMVCTNYDIPVLLAACFDNSEYNIELIGRIKRLLPPKFYTHIDKATLDNVFKDDNKIDIDEYMNMGLWDFGMLDGVDKSDAVNLSYSDIKDIKELISVSYPDAWLDGELVKLGENFGVRVDGKLISFAGIHAYNEEYQVAAVAHVTTHPDYRKMGYCEAALVPLLKSLRKKIKYIGLNVKINNLPAVNCYKKLGFREFGRFIACEIENSTK